MTLGAEPKKLAVLGGLLAVGAIALYFNVFSGDSASSAPAPAPRVAIPAPANVTPQGKAASPSDTRPDTRPDTRRAGRNNGGGEIKFIQGYERPEDRPDPTTIDPALRLDLLAKIQNVEPEAAMRNIFQYGKAPPPPEAAPLPKMPDHPPTIAINNKPPAPPPPAPSGPPPAPQAPPMTFKYYGYRVSREDGRKVAFLLDGEDIIIAGENDDMKRGRYKIVTIGVSSITIEDTQFKSTQTLRLQEEPAA